jgi:hypothetical protein
VVWLILIVICAGVVGIVRANGGQDRLAALGFGVCDGEPCFRGLKVGMDWSETQRLIPEATKIGPPITFVFNDGDEKVAVLIYPSSDEKTVWWINLETSPLSSGISAADTIQRFGFPCGVMLDLDPGFSPFLLIYRNTMAEFKLQPMRLSLESPIGALQIRAPDSPVVCPTYTHMAYGPWYGFTSMEVYLARNRRMMSLTPTP